VSDLKNKPIKGKGKVPTQASRDKVEEIAQKIVKRARLVALQKAEKDTLPN
jgi:hypothetical protein